MIVTDQLKRRIDLPEAPQRIISLVPSQTELLFDLGLREEVVGITKFCIHPSEWFQTKPRIGGTKQLDIEKIRNLSPDLVIANKEENVREQITELEKDFPVYISDVNNLEDALSMINDMGVITGRVSLAYYLSSEIKKQFDALRIKIHPHPAPRVAYLIWKEPLMVAAEDTFIHDMLTRSGFENIFSSRSRYPETFIEEINALGCELLFLSTEPYPFRENDVIAFQEKIPTANVLIVDGEMFSWYGSRLLKAVTYFNELRTSLE